MTMTGKCSVPDCVAPLSCHLNGGDYKLCEHWKKNNSSVEKKDRTSKEAKPIHLPWSGEPLRIDEISLISYRGSPKLIGIVGKADAGKTTFLAMLFTLLMNGKKIGDFQFAGSKTILGWDELHSTLKIEKENVQFPDPTGSEYLRFLHLGLRSKEGRLLDLLLSDSSGEVFYQWSQDRTTETAQNARWVHQNSDAFILFIDCDDLANRLNSAKTEIVDIAQMLTHELNDRPVIGVWSKSDKKEKINKNIRQSLSDDLKRIFSNYEEIDISNFSKEDSDKLVHENNIKVIDDLLEKLNRPSNLTLKITDGQGRDFFLR